MSDHVDVQQQALDRVVADDGFFFRSGKDHASRDSSAEDLHLRLTDPTADGPPLAQIEGNDE